MSWRDIASWAGMAAAAWLLPLLVVRGMLRADGGAELVANYRGRKVARVLGVAWLAWAFGMAAFALASMTGTAGPFTLDAAVSAVLVLGAFSLGLLDDAFGSREHSGLGGHLNALAHGKLTTGVIKLAGIALLAGGAGLWVAGTEAGTAGIKALAAEWVAATLVIAGTANLVNLTDLRPLRALKVYVALALVAAVLQAASLAAYTGQAFSVGVGTLVLLLGPAVAVWGPDSRERGMLGDAGANAAGALAGFWLARAAASVSVVLWGAAVVVVLLNLLSEWVSFTKVIERNRLLNALDMLGRPKG